MELAASRIFEIERNGNYHFAFAARTGGEILGTEPDRDG